jgi:mono/diheme cytochrome c family protein
MPASSSASSGATESERFPFRLARRLTCTAVTEIPEHLLKRSQAAKAKATGGEAPAAEPAEGAAAAASPATTASAPAVPPAAAPAVPAKPAAPVGPPPPKPDSAVVAAAKARQRIPFWAMATLSLLPLWVFMYARGLTPKEPVVHGPLGEGAEIYSGNCSSCHGAEGAGIAGLGYQFSAGEILKTFPHIEDQLRFVYNGTLKYSVAGIEIYGNPDREGGPHITQARGIMPPQGDALTEPQILAVVCHERFTLGGADPTTDFLDEYEKWCSPEAPAWEGLESGELTFDNINEELDDTLVVGTEPAAGQPGP